jgi:hypothetical protein
MILIKFASRGRSEFFKRAIANIHSTISTQEFKILVTADSDDDAMNTRDIQHFCDHHEKVTIIFGTSTSKVNAINRDMEHAGEWDILINMSDDMHFVKQGWDSVLKQRIKEVWGKSLDFFAHFNDGYVGDALATMSIIGRDYYKRDGYVYYPEYKSFSCDAEAYFVAKTRGCHYYFDEVIFKHQHPTYAPMPQDMTYQRNSLATPHDLVVYWGRLHSDFGMKEEGYSSPFLWDQFKKK